MCFRSLWVKCCAGIGAGIAKRLAQAGATVVLHGLGDPAEIEAFQAELARDHDVPVRYVPGNLATPVGVAEMMKAVRVHCWWCASAHGRLMETRRWGPIVTKAGAREQHERGLADRAHRVGTVLDCGLYTNKYNNCVD